MGTKKQHYVPKFYLKNFSNNNKAMVYYKATGEIFPKHLSEICVKNHLYENAWKESGSPIGNYVLYNDIENKLCEKEGIFSPIINMIIALCLDDKNRNSLICHREEKEVLQDFITNIFCRAIWYIQDIDRIDVNDEIESNQELVPYNELFTMIGLGDFETLYKSAMKHGAIDEKTEGTPAYEIRMQLERMEVCFCVAETEVFVTSDFPLVCSFDESEEPILSSVFCPIHPRVGMLFFNPCVLNKLHSYRNRICSVDENEAFKLNVVMMEMDQVKQLISGNKSLLDRLISKR